MSNGKKLPKRSEIADKYKWNVASIYATEDLWEKDFDWVKEKAPEIQKYQGKVCADANHLYEALKLQDDVFMQLEKVYTYAHLRHDEDTTNSTYKGLYDRACGLYAQVGGLFSFVTPEILSVSESAIDAFLKQNQDLQVYAYALKIINAQRPHILSANEEKILAEASEVMASPGQIFSTLNNSDLKFPMIKGEDGEQIEVTHGRYGELMESANREVRKEAFDAMYRTYEKFLNTFATTLSANVKRDVFSARVRNYKSAREAALSINQIPENVYDQLVDTVGNHLDLLQKYVSLRKRVLGVEELHMYDLYTPLLQDVKMKITYEEAKQMMFDGLSVLGDEYVSVLKQAFEEGWVDVYENVGKRSGAYSSGSYLTNPFILLNWTDNVNNLFTLVHEFGHSMHSYYTRKNQPYVYGDYSIFVAEVASTTNENLLNDYLLQTTKDPEQRLYLLNHYLETFRGTVFRQTMFAEFEYMIHQKVEEGTPLTPDLLNALYLGLNKKYYGEKDIVIDDEIAMEWARIPHFYYNYYVYQYATGFSAASALADGIVNNPTENLPKYLDFLKSGSSASPIEVLQRAGVDMTQKEPVEAALNVFEKRLNEMEQLLTEMGK